MGSLARRVLTSADAERRRLERALHDGAQQRLVAVTTTLALAQRQLEAGDRGAVALVGQAAEEATRCLADLRDLARDIYPAALSERGLGGALNDLARRAPGPVEVASAPERRLPEPVEATAYFVVWQALAGLSEGDDATLAADVDAGELVVEVRGATISGAPLELLGDRVRALGGRLEASNRRERPPHMRARIPLDPA